MKIPGLKRWAVIVLCYWLVAGTVICLELTYPEWEWAGLPGFLLSLPLSVLVLAAYVFANYARAINGSNIYFTEYHAEYGLLICSFLNGFLFYPVYLALTIGRRAPKPDEPPPPPTIES